MTTAAGAFCNLLARERGLDAIGSAGSVDLFLTFELPLPWPYNVWESRGIPDEIRELIRVWYGGGTPRPRLRPLAVAPEPDDPHPGLRRVALYRRPAGPFTDFARTEYLVPDAELGPLAWALLVEPSKLPRFARYREPDPSARDVLVCTHGAVDAACAKFGYPLYRMLRARQQGGVRTLRVTHFGGHVFAPTLLELPAGRCWGYLEGEQAVQLLDRTGDVSGLYDQYRGWAGLESPFLQAAEREAWRREGWAWLDLVKRGATLRQEEGWAEVRLEFTRPDGSCGAYEARVELSEPILTPHTTGEPEYPHPQYTVTRLQRTA